MHIVQQYIHNVDSSKKPINVENRLTVSITEQKFENIDIRVYAKTF
jgi:hypothetical protein